MACTVSFTGVAWIAMDAISQGFEEKRPQPSSCASVLTSQAWLPKEEGRGCG